MITPIGGVSFLIAWLMIIVSLRKGLKDGSLN
jgi:uncharacterized membrane protein YgdD (TMEM256/DUF423 family)